MLSARADESPLAAGRNPAIQKNRFSSPHRSHDAAAELRADVRAGLVALMEIVGLQDELVVEIQEHEVGIVPRPQSALTRKTESSGRFRSRQRCDPFERQLA